MSLTATGPVLLLIALYIFAFRPTQLAYYAVFFASFSSTSIINFSSLGYKSGGLGLTPAMTFTMLFFLSYFLYGYITREVRVSSGHLVKIGLLILFLITTYLSLLLNLAMGRLVNPVPTHTVYITIGVVAAILFSLEFVREGGVETAIRVARASAIFVSLWGLLQLVCSITGIPYPAILFNNSNSDFAEMFAQDLGSFSRISSVAVEPSVLAAALLYFATFSVTLLSRDARLRTRYWFFPAMLVLLTLLLSTSSTAYVGLLVTALLVALERPVFSLLVGVPLMTVFLGIVATVPKVRETLLASTIYKSESFSYADRTSAAANDFATFLTHPILGNGWGRAVNFNGAWTLLDNVGVIGTTFFLACGILTIGSLSLGARYAREEDWRLAAYAAGIRNALLVAAAVGFTSGMKFVFLPDWVFWGLGVAIASRLEMTQRVRQHAAAWVPKLRESLAS